MKDIPTVDLANPDKAENVRIVGEAFEQIGFLFVKFLPLTNLLPSVYPVFNEYFNLPEDVKRKKEREDVGHQVGYTPSFTESALACKKTPTKTEQKDAKECYFMRTELPAEHPMKIKFPLSYPYNIWPDEAPDMRPAMYELFETLYDCGKQVLGLLNKHLGLSYGNLLDDIADGPTSLRAIHYPPVTEEQIGKIQWACKHTDINFITVLPVSTRSGLWVRRLDGIWIPGAPKENVAIVQIGDMLQWHTAGRLKSAVHEVRPPDTPTREGRLSAALFIHPRSNLVLNPHWQDGRFLQKIAGDFLAERLRVIGLAGTKY